MVHIETFGERVGRPKTTHGHGVPCLLIKNKEADASPPLATVRNVTKTAFDRYSCLGRTISGSMLHDSVIARFACVELDNWFLESLWVTFKGERLSPAACTI